MMMINKIFYFIILLSFSSGQNIELYLSLIEEGRYEGVKENLQELVSKYPNDPGVLYLKALMTENGDGSIKLYKDILKRFPDSRYAPNSAMKVAEYFYARGLYTQSANLLKNLPVRYPRFNDMQRLTDLMVNSFNAIGEPDSAKYYGLLIKSMFPAIEPNINESNRILGKIYGFISGRIKFSIW